jgi:hypothetical protein
MVFIDGKKHMPAPEATGGRGGAATETPQNSSRR